MKKYIKTLVFVLVVAFAMSVAALAFAGGFIPIKGRTYRFATIGEARPEWAQIDPNWNVNKNKYIAKYFGRYGTVFVKLPNGEIIPIGIRYDKIRVTRVRTMTGAPAGKFFDYIEGWPNKLHIKCNKSLSQLSCDAPDQDPNDPWMP